MKTKLLFCKVKDEIQHLFDRISFKFVAIILTLHASVVNVFATDNGIFDAIDGGSSTFLARIVTLFDTSVFPIALGIFIIGCVFSGTNDRLLAGFKHAIKILVIAFLVLNGINLFTNTLLWIIDLLNGAGSTTIVG